MSRMKNYLPIITGLFIIVGLISFSFIYTYFIKDTLKPPPTFLYNNEGKMVGTYGYPPSFDYLLGVDRLGRDVFWMVIDGAKYTISVALVVGLMRVIFGLLFGIFYGFLNNKIVAILDPLINSFRFVPAVILVLPIFQVFDFGFFDSIEKTIFVQLTVLTLIATPVLMNTIGEEVRAFLKNDFIISSKIIGAGNMWLRRKHVFPFLKTRILLLFVQQTIQTLFLLTQLGIFKLFIGGRMILSIDDGVDRIMSKANEWSAMIGSNYIELSIDPWVIIGPSIAFIVTIFAFNLIKLGIERLMENDLDKFSKETITHDHNFTELNDFDFVNKQNVNENKKEEDTSYILT